jgi:hypothetical protein
VTAGWAAFTVYMIAFASLSALIYRQQAINTRLQQQRDDDARNAIPHQEEQ